MHDLHAAEKVFRVITEAAIKNNISKITKISLELGRVFEHESDIAPENLEYNLRLLLEKTPHKNAEIEIKKTKKKIFLRVVEVEGK